MTTAAEPIRLRATGLDKFLECGVREHRYETGEWQKPEWPEALRGRVVHAARAHYLKTYMKTGGKAPSLADCEDFAEGEASKASEFDHQAVQTGEALDVFADARPYVQLDVLGVLPKIAPHVIAVEERIDVPIRGTGIDCAYVLSGQPDAIGREPVSGRLTIPDLKTGARAQSVAEVNASTQLTAYALLARAKHGEIPTIAHHALRVLKTKPKRVTEATTVVELPAGGFGVCDVIHSTRTADDLDSLLRRVRFVIDAREAGWFAPAAGGFASPCLRCAHRGAAAANQRCEYASATTTGEEKEDAEA